MEYFTEMIIYYPLGSYEMFASIWYESWSECERVLRSGALEAVYTNPDDVAISCERSDIMSNSIRPRMRPENG